MIKKPPNTRFTCAAKRSGAAQVKRVPLASALEFQHTLEE
jgi:hypothetical protein